MVDGIGQRVIPHFETVKGGLSEERDRAKNTKKKRKGSAKRRGGGRRRREKRYARGLGRLEMGNGKWLKA